MLAILPWMVDAIRVRKVHNDYELHEHTRNAGKQLTYRIAVDRWGGYHISLGGKPLRTVTSPHKPAHPYGGKQLRADGVLRAVSDIELLAGMPEE